MIKDVNGKFDYYFISSKNRQILLHWVYELTESDLLLFCFHIFTSFIYSVIIIIFFFKSNLIIHIQYLCKVLLVVRLFFF